MLKQILVVAGGLALAVSLPLVALAVTTERTPALGDYAVQVSDDVSQPMVQQRLRVHAETGRPENFEPVQQRLHQSDDMVLSEHNTLRRHQVDGSTTGQQNMLGRQNTEDNSDGRMHGKDSSAPRPGPSEQPRGNADAPSGDRTGECPSDGEPSGAANGGSGGAGAHGHGGRGNG